MRQFAVPPLILLPALFDPAVVVLDPVLPSCKMSRQWYVPLPVRFLRARDEFLVPLPARFEGIDFPAQAGLPPIDAARVHREWAAHLPVALGGVCRLFKDGNGDERSDAPVKSE